MVRKAYLAYYRRRFYVSSGSSGEKCYHCSYTSNVKFEVVIVSSLGIQMLKFMLLKFMIDINGHCQLSILIFPEKSNREL